MIDGKPYKELMKLEVAGTVWKKNNAIADAANEPGKFTAFCSYEWTSTPDYRNMHRNVFFKDCAKVPNPKVPQPSEVGDVEREGYLGLSSAYQIEGGKIRSRVGDAPFETTVYKLGDKHYAARSNEFGYANYEIPVPGQLGTEVQFDPPR